uniref:RING-type E3 ubiquitin transferase n=1 Tax=Angiostrongylus cantonensis TaxID=6313 RepID=A0A0K0CX97_ANGCA
MSSFQFTAQASRIWLFHAAVFKISHRRESGSLEFFPTIKIAFFGILTAALMLQVRLPHKSLADNTELRLRAGTLSTELSCPICLDLLTQTMTTKECLHRFCADCITTALFRGNKECPTCRKKLVSKPAFLFVANPYSSYSLMPTTKEFQCNLQIWPDRKTYEDLQSVASEKFAAQTNMDALRSSIEEGIKAQEVNRRKRVQGSYECESEELEKNLYIRTC